MARTLTISKCADGLGRFVRVSSEEIIKALEPEFVQEPLAVEKSSVAFHHDASPTYIYGPGSSFNALKHRHVSSTSTGPLICMKSDGCYEIVSSW